MLSYDRFQCELHHISKRLFALLGVGLVAAFLFYDEIASALFLPLFGLFLLLSGILLSV